MSFILCVLRSGFRSSSLESTSTVTASHALMYHSNSPFVGRSHAKRHRSPASAPETIEEEQDEGPVERQSSNFTPIKPPTPGSWAAHRATLKNNFPEGWAPPRKLSRDAMDGLRSLHSLDPQTFSTPVLADKFHISPEAVRRILRSKWQPTKEQRDRLAVRERQHREGAIHRRRQEETTKWKEIRRSQVEAEADGPESGARAGFGDRALSGYICQALNHGTFACSRKLQ
ncbi:hypothetical protein OF83DRAFT_1171026 [Amylostereum chailletii]|nr:hypothetical protein OF83DRAFT_1171026 [Amylostereum chailletii]